MTGLGRVNYGAFLADKRAEILKHLEGSLPTVIVPTSRGIYVFAEEIAKVHSTILIAGAGRMLPSIADWYRAQMTDMVQGWSPREPKASADVNLLQQIFYPNLSVVPDVFLADLVLVEIGAQRSSDYIARVDAFCEMSDLSDEKVVIVSYRVRKENGHNDDESVDEPDTPLSIEARKQAEDAVKAERENELRSEFLDLGMALPDNMEERQGGKAGLLKALEEQYPGKAVLLRRDFVRKKEFDWVFEPL
ncbi:MAG: hypothetical protein AAB897_00825 [Patescibacteria group bacterium]